jgi:hypothetical protein
MILFIFLGILYAQFEKSEKAVFDMTKNLMWQDDEEVVYQEDITMAKVYCETLILNGYTDWYLPSIKQLQSIIDISNTQGYIKKEFRYYKAEKYWSNTPYIEDKTLYWYVDFENGRSNFMDKGTLNTVRCVRDIDE